MSSKPEAPVRSLRREPSQRRAVERVETILDAARALIAEKGSDALRMAEVAERAGVSIGSLYQYFPDKAAIVRVLAERFNAEGLRCMTEEFRGVGDLTGLREAFARLVGIYYGIFLAEPVIRDVWSATQADKALREMELANSRVNGALLAETMARVRPAADPAALEASAFLVMQLGEATMRIAVSVDRAEGDALVATYLRMALGEIAPPDDLGA
jgi:AcrR family transcriptional regulator